jgi:CheY-like chemotaxis protein
MPEPRPSILLVDDSPENRDTITRALRKAGFAGTICCCCDGDEALDFLLRRGRYPLPDEAPRPTIILLDLNLPGTDGLAVLKEIKQNNALRSIPVIILSTSADPRDIEQCYRAGANSYVRKLLGTEALLRLMRSIKEYWLDTVIFPSDNGE